MTLASIACTLPCYSLRCILSSDIPDPNRPQNESLLYRFFEIPSGTLEQYGAFNISLLSDLPLFIDPFLLFNSKKPEYQDLHNRIVTYLRFLKDKSSNQSL